MSGIQTTFVRGLILASVILFASVAQSIEISARIADNKLIVIVDDIKYPNSIIDKELRSGLPNDISLILSINQQEKKIIAIRQNYQITYDLWDEIYTVKITKNTVANSTRRLKSHAELMAFINRIELNSKEAFAQLKTGMTYQLRGQVMINPVETERIDKIRAWIASSQGHAIDPKAEKHAVVSLSSPSSVHSSPTNLDAKTIINQGKMLENIGSARPRFQKLFDQILEQYITSDQVPALWHSQVSTQRVNLTSLRSEK